VALQVLAARHKKPLKTVIEAFLHQLAEATIRQELEGRLKKFDEENKK
jgi:hypothetical protein